MEAEDRDGILYFLGRVRTRLEDTALRGVRAAGRDEIAGLSSLAQELREIEAVRLAERIDALRGAIESRPAEAPERLMEAETCLRLVERVLTLDYAEATLRSTASDEEEEHGDEEEEGFE